jgi:hypothetical protein
MASPTKVSAPEAHAAAPCPSLEVVFYRSFGLSHGLRIPVCVATWLAGLKWRPRRIISILSAQTLGIEGARQPSPMAGRAGHE